MSWTDHITCGLAIAGWAGLAAFWQVKYFRAAVRWNQALDRQIKALEDVSYAHTLRRHLPLGTAAEPIKAGELVHLDRDGLLRVAARACTCTGITIREDCPAHARVSTPAP